MGSLIRKFFNTEPVISEWILSVGNKILCLFFSVETMKLDVDRLPLTAALGTHNGFVILF